MVSKNLVPLDKWSATNLVPVHPHSLSPRQGEPNFGGPSVHGDRIVWGLFVQRDLSIGDLMLGTKCPGTICVWTKCYSHKVYQWQHDNKSFLFILDGGKAKNSKELITLLSTEITSNVSSPMSVLSEFFFMRCTKIEWAITHLTLFNIKIIGWAPWNLSCFEFKFDDTRLSS